MIKTSALSDLLEQAKSTAAGVGAGAQAAGNSIKNWYGALNPDLKSTLMHGLAGAAIGGAATGGLASTIPEDRENPRAVVNQALLGAILGGTAGLGVSAGSKMLKGQLGLMKEDPQPLLGRATDAVTNTAISNALPLAGLGAGLYKTRDTRKALGEILRKEVPGHIEIPSLMRKGPGAAKDTLERLRAAFAPENADLWRKDRDAFGKVLGPRSRSAPMRYGKGKLAWLPALVAAGFMADRYVKGKY